MMQEVDAFLDNYHEELNSLIKHMEIVNMDYPSKAPAFVTK